MTRAAPQAVRLLALLALVFFLITAFRAGFTQPATDFPNYYTAAVLVRKGEPLRRYYDWTWFQRQMNYAGIERQLGAYTAQTPLTMLPLLELTPFAPQTAKQIWLVLNLLFLMATLWLLSRVTRFRVEQIGLVAFCGYGSLYFNFFYGQYYIFLLFLLTLSFYFLHRRNFATSGIISGVAFGLKLYGGPLLPYFAARRRWKAVIGMIGASICLAGIAVAIFGWADVMYYATQMLPRSLEGGSVDPYHPGNPTLSTMLRRLFVPEPDLNPDPIANAPQLFFFFRTLVSLAILVFTTMGVAASTTTSERRDFAWFMLAVMLLSTNVATYTYILLLLPLVLLLEEAGPRERAFLLVSYILLTLPLPLERFFPKVWLLLALFIVPGRYYWRPLRRTSIAIAACLVALFAVWDARRHMHAYANEPARHFRRIPEKGEFLASSPAVSKFGLFYQSMGKDRYVLHWFHDNRVEEFSFDGHALEPVASTPAGPIYFELVAHGRSTIMRLDASTGKAEPTPLSAMSGTKDAAVSPDGKWVAFTLTRIGSQQIWLRNVASGKAEPLTGGNCNSGSPAWELDSRAVIFASDCGRALGITALYRAPLEEVKK